MKIANAIHKISDFLDRIGGVLCVVMLAAMVILTGTQIICRVFFSALDWSEELTRYLLVWSTFLGAGVVYKHAGHINVSLLQDHVPPVMQKIMKLLVHVICGVFCVIAVYYGFKYMKAQGLQLSPAMRIPMRYMYMSIPVGFSLLLVHILNAIIQLFVKKPGSENKEVTAT